MMSPLSINIGETLAETPGSLGVVALPLPAEISANHPLPVSEAVGRLLARTLALCRPDVAGTAAPPVDDGTLRELTAQCTAASASVARLSSLSDDERSFDRFFGIERHASPDAPAIGVVWGLIALLYELARPHSLTPIECSTLVTGFYRLAQRFAPVSAQRDERRPERATQVTGRTGSVLNRWRNGHLIFVALVDGLIQVHACAIGAIENRCASEAIEALRGASCLLSASGAAMRLAGDMSTDEYEAVRRVMAPPHVPANFSGLFNADHRELLRRTKAMGGALATDWPEIASAREDYWRALNDAYDAHRWVCDRLVGTAPSLASATQQSQQPAPEKLKGFARRAMRFSGFPGEPDRS
jgi:hypothetical protein